MAPRTGPWKWCEQKQESRTRNLLRQKLCPCSCSLRLFVTMSYHCSGLKLSGFSRWSVPWSNFPSNASLIVQEFAWSSSLTWCWVRQRKTPQSFGFLSSRLERYDSQEKAEGEKEGGKGKLMFLQPSDRFIKASYAVHFSTGGDSCDFHPCIPAIGQCLAPNGLLVNIYEQMDTIHGLLHVRPQEHWNLIVYYNGEERESICKYVLC